MTTIYTTQRTGTASGRARRADRAIAVIPTPAEGRADAAPAAAAELHGILEDALESTREATASAQRELRVAEAERSRTARALEYDLRPMKLDETGRARLRAAYASADSVVAEKRDALDRARTLESAAQTIADSIGALESDQDLSERLTATLALWQIARVREPQGAGETGGSRLRRL